MVVNVYKHGEGKSFDDLKKQHPGYINDPFKTDGGSFLNSDDLDHTNLMVNDAQIEEFSIAIVEFWRKVPANIFASEVGSVSVRFEKAILKDRETNKGRGDEAAIANCSRTTTDGF